MEKVGSDDGPHHPGLAHFMAWASGEGCEGLKGRELAGAGAEPEDVGRVTGSKRVSPGRPGGKPLWWSRSGEWEK